MLTQTIENLFNRNLASSPRARELCAELAGRPLQVNISGTPWSLRVEALGTSLRLSPASSATHATADGVEHAAATTVTGSAINLLAMVSGDPSEVIRRGAVRIDGDAEIAQRYQDLLRLLRPNIEEELSAVIGDSPAHQLMRVAKLAVSFGKRAVDTTVRNGAEYLAHESADLVPRAEAEQFLNGVAQLREAADRLEARVALLTARREKPAP